MCGWLSASLNKTCFALQLFLWNSSKRNASNISRVLIILVFTILTLSKVWWSWVVCSFQVRMLSLSCWISLGSLIQRWTKIWFCKFATLLGKWISLSMALRLLVYCINLCSCVWRLLLVMLHLCMWSRIHSWSGVRINPSTCLLLGLIGIYLLLLLLLCLLLLLSHSSLIL